MVHTYAHSSQLEKVISGAGAFGMHLLFIALLVFGANWQKKVEPQANIVDLWTNLPSPAQPKIEPPPPPPPRPVMPPKIEPAPPPKVVAKPDIAKPDIALKEKAEKERRTLEQKKSDAKKREDEAKAEQKQEQQAKEAAEAQRFAKEKEADDAKRKIAEAVAAQNKLIDEYRARIQARIYQAMQPFDDLPRDTFAEVEITVLPDGNVLATVIKKNSASARFNAAVERAVLKSQPLPVPKDATLFGAHFRRIDLTFRAKQ